MPPDACIVFLLNRALTMFRTVVMKEKLMSQKKKFIGFLALISAATCSFAGQTLAQVAKCQALTLYGNAAQTGLCKSLSTGNHWVCALADNPDIHLTLNNATALHITVRTPACEGNAYLAGAWPANLTLAAGQPTVICGVNVQNYVARLNAQPQSAAPPTCQTSFVNAQAANRIDPATATFYVNNCNNPPPPCP